MALLDLLREAENTGGLPRALPELAEHTTLELSSFRALKRAEEIRLAESAARIKELSRMLRQIDAKLGAATSTRRLSPARIRAALHLFRTGQLRETRQWQEHYRSEIRGNGSGGGDPGD
jgi:hypothetical protein